TILEINDLKKTYDSGDRHLTVLEGINFTLQAGDTCAIVGPSGSGKTTLLGLCAGLDRASSGSVILNGVRLDNLSEDARAQVRNQYVGFIFQNFQLILRLTSLENGSVRVEPRGERSVPRQAMELQARVSLYERDDHYRKQLSAGEQ